MKVEVDIGGFVGTGASLKAARESAQEQAAAALRGEYAPRVHTFGGMVLLVYRTPRNGWESAWIVRQGGERQEGRVRSSGGRMTETPESLAESGALQAAQQQWSPNSSDAPPEYLPKSAHADFASWVRFQRKYDEGRAAGLDDNMAHQYAGNRFASLQSALDQQARSAA